jgi:lysozyme
VRGIDVSHHQRRIDWVKLGTEGYDFAFLKATEGGDLRDPLFAANWPAAASAGLARGAYHFFTFCTGGEKQAKNFIAALAPGQEMLPPAVDIEFHGNCARPPDPAAIRAELTIFLERIEAAYGRRPILYATKNSYARIVAGAFLDYPVWARNILHEPRLDREWSFWQYADRGRVDGVGSLVDLDLFRGTRDEFTQCVKGGNCR